MKIIIPKTELVRAITTVARAVPNKTTMSILECIMIDATGSKILMIANDLDLGIQTTVDGEITENGKIAVNASLFSNIVRTLPDNEVTLTAAGDKLSISCEQTKAAIQGRDGDDFSYLPEVEKKREMTITHYTLKNMITKTLFSASTNESNGMMTGELLEIKDEKMRMVALDGHRIAIRNIAINSEENEQRVIIPGKTLNEISKILSGDTEQHVSVYFTDKHVLFEMKKTIIVSRLMEGNYYNIDSMLSNQYSTTVKVNKNKLLECIIRATTLVKEEDKKPIIIMIGDKSMELKINTAIGSMNDIVEIEKTGENMNIGFNPKFMIDALRAIDEEEITMNFVSPKAPCFIKKEDEYCYLILPVNFINVD